MVDGVEEQSRFAGWRREVWLFMKAQLSAQIATVIDFLITILLEKKIGELQVRQQRLADRMIAVAESAKEEYNLEYQNKIADGIDNYEKVIERYLRGDASREEVISAGEKLKEDAALLNVAPDKGIIAELNKEAEILKSEFAAMAAEIKKTEKKGKETVN